MTHRVLIVEDDAEIRAIERTLVEDDLEMIVDEAATVKEALESIRRNPPDLVILDLLLPDGDGSEVLRGLRGEGRKKTMPVMVVTAMTGSADRARVLAAGATDIMYKPFDAQAFVRHALSLIANSTGSDHAAPSPG